MKKVKINDITIRDIFQNVDSGYISEKLLSRTVEHLSKIKFDSLEIFGGSAFEKMLDNNFGKSPFEIAYEIKNKNPGISLQALIGARNLVGMEIYVPAVIKKFIGRCVQSGIDRFKVFDALNDRENFKYTISAINETGSHCQGTIIYDDLKEVDYYLETADSLVKYGCGSICIKDVQSTLLPQKTGVLFKALSGAIVAPVYLGGYNLRGLQVSNYYNACLSGCNGVDLSFIPSSYTDLSPAIFALLLSFKDTNISVDIEYLKVLEIFEWFKQNIYSYLQNDLLYSRFLFSNKNTNLAPKWLLSSINRQLNDIGESNKIDLVLDELFKIKNEIGNPSLATPVGQILGSQAILNAIISDHRWEITNDEIKKLINGYYGKLPRDVGDDLKEKIFAKNTSFILENDDMDKQNDSGSAVPGKEVFSGGTESPSTLRNKDRDFGTGGTDNIEDKTYGQCADELKNLSTKESDILSYLFFPDKTLKFLENGKHASREAANGDSGIQQGRELRFPEMLDLKKAAKFEDIDLKKLREVANLVETSNIDEISLEIDGVKISINKKSWSQKSADKHGPSDAATAASVQSKTAADSKGGVSGELSGNPAESGRNTGPGVIDENLLKIKAPIVGTFYRSPSPGAPPFVSAGDKVKKGDTLCIIEAMKLMNKINSEYDGEIVEILVQNEEAVEYDQTIIIIKPLNQK
jgi:oxaloacetate decarboxylase (Na+ extruding) subunit alpha